MSKIVDFYNDPVVLRWDKAQNFDGWLYNVKKQLYTHGHAQTHYFQIVYDGGDNVTMRGKDFTKTIPMYMLGKYLRGLAGKVDLLNPTITKKSVSFLYGYAG